MTVAPLDIDNLNDDWRRLCCGAT